MADATTLYYSFTKPEVGASEDTWGGKLNGNWDALDTLLGGVTNVEFAILDGATITTAELNVLDGVTATTAEINYLDGVTTPIQTQLDAKQATLVSGTNIKTLNGQSVLGSGDVTIGGGSWVLLSTVTASSSATVVFEDLFTSAYTNYAIVAEGIIPATNGQELYAQYKVGGAYATSGYQFLGQEALVDGTMSTSTSSVATEIRLNSNTGNASGRNCVLNMMIFAPLSANHKLVNLETYGVGTNATPNLHVRTLGTLLTSTSTMTGIKFYMGSGNISAGTFRLYGIKNS